MNKLIPIAACCLMLLGCPDKKAPKPDVETLHENSFEIYWNIYSFPLNVYIPAEHPDWWKNAVRNAALEWNDVLGCYVMQVYEIPYSDNMFQLGLVLPGNVVIDKYEISAFNHRGQSHIKFWPDTKGGLEGRIHHVLVVLDSDLIGDDLYVVALHEFGHVLTLAHDAEIESIMHTPVQAGSKITDEDARIVRAKAGCL